MTCTYSQARDDIFGLLLAAWMASDILDPMPEPRWPGVDQSVLPPSSDYWLTVAVTNVVEKQSTLRNGVAPDAHQRYTAKGLVEIELFSPMSVGDALEKSILLAEVARNAYRGKHSDNGVWFRDCTIAELPSFRDWYRISIVAKYEYDEIG